MLWQSYDRKTTWHATKEHRSCLVKICNNTNHIKKLKYKNKKIYTICRWFVVTNPKRRCEKKPITMHIIPW